MPLDLLVVEQSVASEHAGAAEHAAGHSAGDSGADVAVAGVVELQLVAVAVAAGERELELALALVLVLVLVLVVVEPNEPVVVPVAGLVVGGRVG